MQVSSRESKDGNEAKLEACKTFSRVIAAGLHRVATAMAKDSECISKASKVSQRVKDAFCMIYFAARPIYAVIPMLGLSLSNECFGCQPFIPRAIQLFTCALYFASDEVLLYLTANHIELEASVQYLQVFDLWQRRQILAKSVLKPALQLLTKMKAEHASADAAAAALRTGQLPLLRRPMRLVMPYASLHSDTGLPTFTVSLPLDQWGSLAGFRCCPPVCLSHTCLIPLSAWHLLRGVLSKSVHATATGHACE